jgi:hypothetical protein
LVVVMIYRGEEIRLDIAKRTTIENRESEGKTSMRASEAWGRRNWLDLTYSTTGSTYRTLKKPTPVRTATV